MDYHEMSRHDLQIEVQELYARAYDRIRDLDLDHKVVKIWHVIHDNDYAYGGKSFSGIEYWHTVSEEDSRFMDRYGVNIGVDGLTRTVFDFDYHINGQYMAALHCFLNGEWVDEVVRSYQVALDKKRDIEEADAKRDLVDRILSLLPLDNIDQS